MENKEKQIIIDSIVAGDYEIEIDNWLELDCCVNDGLLFELYQ